MSDLNNYYKNQFAKDEEFWTKMFSDDIIISQLPYFDQSSESDYELEEIEIKIDNLVSEKLLSIANGSDFRLHIILISGLLLLLKKYSFKNNFTIGTPIYGKEDHEKYLNTILPINYNFDNINTYKELLIETQKLISNINDHQNYSVEKLIYNLNGSDENHHFPLFDIGILLENIQNIEFLKKLKLNTIFSFIRDESNEITCKMFFNRFCYDKSLINKTIQHFQICLFNCLNNLDEKINAIDFLNDKEQYELLNSNNSIQLNNNIDTIDNLFEKTVEQYPNNIALMFNNQQITYEKLNEKANKLARHLIESGVKPNTIVGVLMNRSIDSCIAFLAVLKSGAAYLPIDDTYPKERISYILKDSSANILITSGSQNLGGESYKNINLNDEKIQQYDGKNIEGKKHNIDNIIYTIYTSGSSGKPKGVLVSHKAFNNLLFNRTNKIKGAQGKQLSSVASISFDANAFEIWPALTSGSKLHIADEEITKNPMKMKNWILDNSIEISYQSTLMAEQLLNSDWSGNLNSLKVLYTAGDRLKVYSNNKIPFDFYNLYGPTEDTVWTTTKKVPKVPVNHSVLPSIGTPNINKNVFIINSDNQVLPSGFQGELYISGEGIALGYLNNVELTHQKFVSIFDKENNPGYKTGDLARWNLDGEIEFIGRSDNQVSIRGYRIELEEIEKVILDFNLINQSVVIVDNKDRLIGFFTADNQVDNGQLNSFLEKKLPGFMIPGSLYQLEELPVTPNGKLDKRKLEKIQLEDKKEITKPVNDIENKLLSIWAQTLDLEEDIISTNGNFFELGGHSLNVNVMVENIQRILKSSLTVKDVFQSPTIKELSKKIELNNSAPINSILKSDKKKFYDLSSAQKRFFIFQQTNIESTLYNLPVVFELEGNLDPEKLQSTFQVLTDRHEALRTNFILKNDEAYQIIHDKREVDFELIACEENNVKELIQSQIKPFDLEKSLLLRVRLIKLDENKHILFIDLHHIISDAVSVDIMIDEFMQIFNNQELEPLKIEYSDYIQWNQKSEQQETINKQKLFWIDLLRGELPQLNLPLDFKRSKEQVNIGETIDFEIFGDEYDSLKRIAHENDSTVFMLLLSIYYIFLNKITNQKDIVIGLPVANRNHPDTGKIIGSLINTVVLRNKINEDLTFCEILRNVKTHVLDVLENQGFPFEDLVEELNIKKEFNRNPIFDVFFDYNNIDIDRFKLPDLKLKRTNFFSGSSKFDFSLFCFEYSERIEFNLEYNKALFESSTINEFVSFIKDIIAKIIENNKVLVKDISISSEFEKADSQIYDIQMDI